MLNDRELSAAVGSTAYDADGDKIGTVEHFFIDDVTGAPTWVAVSTGLFGTRHSVVPAAEASFADGVLRLPVRKDAVKHAPHVDTDHLDATAESELRRHYGLAEPSGTEADDRGEGRPAAPEGRHAAPDPGTRPGGDDRDRPWSPTETGVVPVGAVQGAADTEPPGPVALTDEEVAAARGDDDRTPTAEGSAGAGPRGAAGEAAEPGRAAGEAAGPRPGEMVRGEEQLRVRTESVPGRRVRVVKYVVTEEVQITVPVRREEIRLEEVPAGEAAGGPAVTGEYLAGGGTTGGPEGGTTGGTTPGAASPGAPGGPAGGPAGGGAGGELPDEIVLHAERPVVSVEVVPVERVRLRTETVTSEEQVTERLQREQVVVDDS